MDRKKQVAHWILKKIEKVLNEDIKLKIVAENSPFDVETYVDYLLDKYFNEHNIESLRKSLNIESYYDSYYFGSENSSDEQDGEQNSLEFETNEYQTFSLEEIIKNLENNSEEVKTKFLQLLEVCAEDLISQNLLIKIVEILEEILNKTENIELVSLTLKILRKLLRCPKKPQIICKGFISITKMVAHQIDLFNLKVDNALEKIDYIKGKKRACEIKSSGFEHPKFSSKSLNCFYPEILIKLMWLLLDCQQQIRINGMRFNEARSREIIFSFINLLCSTTATSENTTLSGLELVSVLDPKANWCKYWCHTAVGRTLLCSALRKYKNFFTHIIEVMIKHMKITKSNRLPSVAKNVNLDENSQKSKENITESVEPFHSLNIGDSLEKEIFSDKKKSLNNDRHSYSAHRELNGNDLKKKGINKIKKKDINCITKGIPRRIVSEAVFLHSVSMMSCLIQFQSGRALFPVQTATKKRLLNVQDLLIYMIEYLENFKYCKYGKMSCTSAYQAKVSEILNDLRKLKSFIISSRVSTERQWLSYL